MTRPRILFVADNAPWPPRSGGAQRTALLLRALREAGDVDFFFVDRFRADPDRLRVLRDDHGMIESVTPWADPRSLPGRIRFVLRANLDLAAALVPGGMERAYTPEPRVSRRLAAVAEAGGYDIVVGRYLRAAALAGVLQRSPVILDLDDHDVRIHESRLEAPGAGVIGRVMARRAAARLRPLVPRLLARCDHVWVTSDEDRARIAPVPATVLPNIPWPDAPVRTPAPPPPDAPMLLVGTMDYDVNARATDRFIAAVWPRIREGAPAARLRIVGTGLSRRQARRWGVAPGVEPVGPVDDLAAEYAGCAFAVAPIFEGGGTKIKVLEAFRHGRSVVAAAHAHRGFEDVLIPDESMIVAADEAGLAAACVALLRDPGRAARMAERGKAAVESRFGWDRFRDVVVGTVEAVLVA